MTEEAKEARRAYKRKWYRTHRESAAASQAKYWEKRARQQADAQADSDRQDGSKEMTA